MAKKVHGTGHGRKGRFELSRAAEESGTGPMTSGGGGESVSGSPMGLAGGPESTGFGSRPPAEDGLVAETFVPAGTGGVEMAVGLSSSGAVVKFPTAGGK